MSPFTVLIPAAAMLAAYAIGSIPTGVLLVRIFSGEDIRRLGSGNIGATNARRVAGNRLGALVLSGDVLKGFLPVLLAMGPIFAQGADGERGVAVTALGAFLGHLYPLYFRGRSGGKGVAVAAGCFLAISPVALVGSLLVFILVVWRRRVVSLGSMSAAALLPLFVWLWEGASVFWVLAGVVAVLIFIRHSGNIRRLRAGTEPQI